MNDTQPAIIVKDLYKSFNLPHERHDGIKQLLLNGIGKKRGYEKQQVLKDISFEIKQGEFFGIVGRNGSGKSTLLKLLAGIYAPDEGLIQVNGTLTPFIELGVGFNPELTGRENVYLNGALLGFSKTEMNGMYHDIVEFAELEKFMDQKLKNYSSGMQVRLAFSIAIRAKTDMLILDEVLAVGDTAFQKKCFNYFMRLKKEHRTVVLVTHDMSAVRQYCDRAMMLEKGNVAYVGSVEKTAQAYQRLFDDKPEQTDVNSGDRWGTGKVHVTKSEIKKDDGFYTLKTSFMAKVTNEKPIFGFTIQNSRGINIFEGNTLRVPVDIGLFQSGGVVTLEWKFPDIFTTDTYTVSVAVCNYSATEFYDWVNNALTFEAQKSGSTAGMVDPEIHVRQLSK